jgi:hypothetical protein
MTPLDFVVFDGDSCPNDPIFRLVEALRNPIKIVGLNGEMEVLSYYLDGNIMVLEVGEKRHEP